MRRKRKENKVYHVLTFKEKNVPANEEPYAQMFLLDKELTREQLEEIADTQEAWKMADTDAIPEGCPEYFADFGWHKQLITVVEYISKKYGIKSRPIPYREQLID